MSNKNQVFYRVLQSALLSTIFFLSACATSGISGDVDPAEQKKASDVVHIENKSLSKKLDIKGFSSRVIGDLLNVQVIIQNQFSSDQAFQYKFSWYDKNGFEIDNEANSWVPVIMHGKESKTIQGVAPNPTVTRYRVVLRELDQ